jgi:SAM-dependent methyltransferase
MSRRSFSTGSGPGAITPDGCAVDLYRSLPVGDEPAIIHATVPPQASILELGCGTGRVTHPLIALGHQLTAVDESPEMLAHLRGARVVCGRIEELALDERFDVVVLGSHLVNVPDDDALAAILACCARHVAATGCVVIERHPESWFDDAKDMERCATASPSGCVTCRDRPLTWSRRRSSTASATASGRSRSCRAGLMTRCCAIVYATPGCALTRA